MYEFTLEEELIAGFKLDPTVKARIKNSPPRVTDYNFWVDQRRQHEQKVKRLLRTKRYTSVKKQTARTTCSFKVDAHITPLIVKIAAGRDFELRYFPPGLDKQRSETLKTFLESAGWHVRMRLITYEEEKLLDPHYDETVYYGLTISNRDPGLSERDKEDIDDPMEVKRLIRQEFNDCQFTYYVELKTWK